eukprot:743027-Rhodomonas_salina.1
MEEQKRQQEAWEASRSEMTELTRQVQGATKDLQTNSQTIHEASNSITEASQSVIAAAGHSERMVQAMDKHGSDLA